MIPSGVKKRALLKESIKWYYAPSAYLFGFISYFVLLPSIEKTMPEYSWIVISIAMLEFIIGLIMVIIYLCLNLEGEINEGC